jgi:hypothetical protein
MWIGAGLLGLYLYTDTKKNLGEIFVPKPWTQEQAVKAVSRTGVPVVSSGLGTFIKIDDSMIKVTENWNPNFAQRVLIGVDRFVPGSFLTKWALT